MRVLFAPETFNLGETSRAVEVAQALRAEGHEVRFMGYSERFAEYVRDAGFSISMLEPDLSERDADRLIAADQGRSLRHPFTSEMVRQRVDSELTLINDWRPDRIVIGTTLTLFISARVAGVPLIYIRPYAMGRSHLRQMTTFPLVPGDGTVAIWVNRFTALLVRRIVPGIRWKPASFRRVAAEHGLRLPSRTLDSIDADYNLIASLFPYLDQRPLAQNELAVGPIYAQAEGEVPSEVVRVSDNGRPTIYVGLGSSATRKLALRVLTQLAALDIDIVTSAGRYLTREDRARLPANVNAYEFLPAHRLADYIDASVIHGGEGTVQTACASGVPFVGIGLQTEQRINIDECVNYGNALRFTFRTVRRGELPAMVERMLHDPTMRAAAHEMQQRSQPVGAGRAATAIVAGPPQTRSSA